MRVIINVIIIPAYYLALIHGLVIPRDEFGDLGTAFCDGLTPC